MAEIDKHNLKHWSDKIVNDPEMLAEDKNGKKIGEQGFDGTITRTYCNIAFNRICRALGYDSTEGMLANDIFKYMQKFWINPYGTIQEQAEMAHKAASYGDICAAGISGSPHGHVAIIYPQSPMVYSGKWRLYVPFVANVGKNNGIIGTNYAFDKVPDFFILGKVPQ